MTALAHGSPSPDHIRGRDRFHFHHSPLITSNGTLAMSTRRVLLVHLRSMAVRLRKCFSGTVTAADQVQLRHGLPQRGTSPLCLDCLPPPVMSTVNHT